MITRHHSGLLITDTHFTSGVITFVGWERIISALIKSEEISLSQNQRIKGIEYGQRDGLTFLLETK